MEETDAALILEKSLVIQRPRLQLGGVNPGVMYKSVVMWSLLLRMGGVNEGAMHMKSLMNQSLTLNQGVKHKRSGDTEPEAGWRAVS